MNKLFFSMMTAGGAIILASGCSTAYDKGPYLPQESITPAHEDQAPVVALDPGTQRSVTYSGVQQRTLEDGRLEVNVRIRNRENRRIEIQANCVFKDLSGFSTGDETPFQTLILTENGTEGLTFVSMNNLAKKYTIRLRQAH